MRRILGSLNRSGSRMERNLTDTPQGDSPESVIVREIVAFCESGNPEHVAAGNEFLHLPTIVTMAESAPTAAKEAANRIRKFLGKDTIDKGYMQYNSIMLIRILTDNPGPQFTKNIDKRFITTVQELLREGKDLSVQQILRETLDSFEATKSEDENLKPLLEMWKKEKLKSNRSTYGPNNPTGPSIYAPAFQQSNYYSRQHSTPRTLPGPDELSARIEEAKTTAKLLSQTVQSTPTSDLQNDDLIKEFAQRAQSASRSIQGYIHANPGPDEDTLLTLIETNDALSLAMSKHSRAILQARKTYGPSPAATPPITGEYSTNAPPNQPLGRFPGYSSQPGLEQQTTWTPSNQTSGPENPFTDTAAPEAKSSRKGYSLFSSTKSKPSAPLPPPPPGSPPLSNAQATYYPSNPVFEAPDDAPAIPHRRRPSLQESQNSRYNPDYQASASYYERQDSATNGLMMHGATPPTSPPPAPTAASQGRVSTLSN